MPYEKPFSETKAEIPIPGCCCQSLHSFLPGMPLKDKVLKRMLLQEQTEVGQQTMFKVTVAIGDHSSHVWMQVAQAGTCCHPQGLHPGHTLHHLISASPTGWHSTKALC